MDKFINTINSGLESKYDLEESLDNLSVKDIMKFGFDEETATAIFDANNNIGTEHVNIKQLFAEMDACLK